MNTTSMIESVSIESLTELLQNAGYRVTASEQNGQTQLLSASQGMGFAVRMGNPAPQGEQNFVDYTLSCALRVQGDLPDELVPQWNTTKRFARLTRQGDFLVMEMDVVAAGGVSETYLRATTELWDRLMQEFLLYLRTFSEQAASAQNASATSGTAVDAASSDLTSSQEQADAADAQTDTSAEHTDHAAQTA